MKVKRFLAQTMAEGLKQVSQEMGPDAVILSSRRVDDGVEIVTALEYDENMARQQLGDKAREATSGARLAELQAEQHRRLMEELQRSRERIRQARNRHQPEVENGAVRNMVRPQAEPEATAAQDFSGPSSPDRYSRELARMREEISLLKELVGETRSGRGRSGLGAVQQRLSERLEEFGLSAGLAASLARQYRGGPLEDGWKQTLKMLAAGVRTSCREWLDEGGIYALAGPTGSGKTTTIGKLAARYVLRHGPDSLALVTTDRYRVAAHEQLFVFGRILNVPVRVVDESHSLDDILDELADRHLVLIDTAGLTASDPGCQEQLSELARSRHPLRTHLVVSATSQPRIMKSVWHCYKMAALAGCVVTKVDEAMTLGESLGFVMETGLPVAYYTDGQKIPEDLHHAEAAPLVRMGVERLKLLRQQTALAEGA